MIKNKLKMLLESEYDVAKINIPISVASKGDVEYLYCAPSCIYLDEDTGECKLFKTKLDKDSMYKRNDLCLNS